MKEQITIGEQPKKEARLSRRAFIASGVLAAAGCVGNRGVSAYQEVATPSIEHEEATDSPLDGGHTTATHETGEHGSSLVNDATSYAIVGLFGYTLSEILRGKRDGFDWQTVKRLTAAEVARLAALRIADKEAFDHDKKEIFSSYPLAGMLIPLAEVASHLKVSNDRIFDDEARTQRLIESIGLRTRTFEHHPSVTIEKNLDRNISEESSSEDPNDHTIPFSAQEGKENYDEYFSFNELDLGEDVETWENYQKELQESIVQSLARNAAVTATFAPFFTTYSSSAIADANHRDIFELVAKHEYAKRVVKHKQHSESHAYDSVVLPDAEDEMKDQAVDTALSHMNGFGGFNHLSLALAANGDGMGMFGDPPMLFYLQRHGPEEFLELSAKGLSIAQLSNVGLNFMYLQKLGIRMESVDFGKKFLAYEGKTLSKIKDTFANGPLRDVSIKGARGVSKDITDILRRLHENDVTEDEEAELLDRMASIPEPVMTVDLPSIVQEKLDIVNSGLHEFVDKKILRKNGQESMFEHFLEEFSRYDIHDENDFISFINSREFREVCAEGTQSERMQAMVSAMQKGRTDEETSKLTALLESLLFHTVPQPDGDGPQRLLHEDEEQNVPSVESLMSQLHEIPVEKRSLGLDVLTQEIMKLSGESSEENAIGEEEAMAQVHKIYEQLGIVTREGVREALQDALLLAEEEDPEHEENTLLGEQADEFTKAILSQLPITPALAHAIVRTLETYANNGEFTQDKLKNIINTSLTIDAVTSANADNVVAYLLTESVLESMMREYYGESYEENKSLQEAIWTGSILVAMSAGGNSKYGNGPNMLKREYDAHMEPHSMELGGTYRNPYAIAQTAIVGLGASYLIKKNLPEENLSQE